MARSGDTEDSTEEEAPRAACNSRGAGRPQRELGGHVFVIADYSAARDPCTRCPPRPPPPPRHKILGPSLPSPTTGGIVLVSSPVLLGCFGACPLCGAVLLDWRRVTPHKLASYGRRSAATFRGGRTMSWANVPRHPAPNCIQAHTQLRLSPSPWLGLSARPGGGLFVVQEVRP